MLNNRNDSTAYNVKLRGELDEIKPTMKQLNKIIQVEKDMTVELCSEMKNMRAQGKL